MESGRPGKSRPSVTASPIGGNPSTDLEFLGREARRAKTAIKNTATETLEHLQTGLSPRRWAESYPKATVAASAGTGLVAGAATAFFATRALRRRKRQTPPDLAPDEEFVAIRRLDGARRTAGEKVRPGAGRKRKLSQRITSRGLSWVGRTLFSALTHAAATAGTSAASHTEDGESDEEASHLAPWTALSLHESPISAVDDLRATHVPVPPPGPGLAGGRRPPHEAGLGGKLWYVVKTTFASWYRDDSFHKAAALAYYTLFSLAPLLVIVIGIAGLILERNDVQVAVLDQIGELVGSKGREAVATMVDQTAQTGRSLSATLLGLALLLMGASGVFFHLKLALNNIWGMGIQSSWSIWSLIRDRFLSFALVLGLGFLFLVSLVVDTAIAASARWIDRQFALPAWGLELIHLGFGFVVISVVFGMIYKWLPDMKLTWKQVALGAAVTGVLFMIGKSLIGLYLGSAATRSTYGAAASAVLILLWAYYSGLIFLLGAEFTHVFATSFGPRPTRNHPGHE